MRINIWIRRGEAVSGNITKYYNIAPQTTDWPNYVQVSITQDEFARLEDNGSNKSAKLTLADIDEMSMKPEKEDWLVEQYNRNRSQEEWVKTREDIPYIFEKNPNNGCCFGFPFRLCRTRN